MGSQGGWCSALPPKHTSNCNSHFFPIFFIRYSFILFYLQMMFYGCFFPFNFLAESCESKLRISSQETLCTLRPIQKPSTLRGPSSEEVGNNSWKGCSWRKKRQFQLPSTHFYLESNFTPYLIPHT